MQCFICRKNIFFNFLNLGFQPPSDSFLRPRDLNKPEVAYPLELALCENCQLVQLNYVVDPKKLFVDYVYNTSANNSLKANFKNLAELLVERFKLNKRDLVVDIGSNDGTLLSYFKPHKVKILGVDPSSSAKLASKLRVPTVRDFFSAGLAAKIRKERGQAQVILATNVFAHVDKLDDFLRGVKTLLAEDGIFVSESSYLLDMIQKLQYDSIYHEHLRYYSVTVLNNLFKKHGLEIMDVERIPSHGGSIRVYAGRRGKYPVVSVVRKLIHLEKRTSLDKKETYTDFTRRVLKNRLEIQKFVLDCKIKGKKVVGVGAPAKGNTLINFCKLGPDTIDYLVENSPLKIGLFTPGAHIPVVEEKRLFIDQPDYAILFSWNIAAELIAKLRSGGYRGKFVIPTPKLKIF